MKGFLHECDLWKLQFVADFLLQYKKIYLLESVANEFWSVFSVTRRSRSDESHWLTELLSVLTDFTDVTLVSDDTYRRLYWCDPDDPDESYQVMKVI